VKILGQRSEPHFLKGASYGEPFGFKRERRKAMMPLCAKPFTKLQSCHCEEQSDVAIYHVEIISHSFAMTFINSSRFNSH
jgi:hypothetical protein